MASYDDTNVLKNKLDWAKAFNRSFSLPLDRSSMFASKADADAYARGDGSDSRALGKTSYIGQIVTVYENDTVNVYVIDNDRTLTKLASGGSTKDIEEKLSAEISARISADVGLSSSISTLIETTLPLSVGNLQSSLSATVEKLDVPETGFEATYVVKQGGVLIGASINIPKDKVISSAYMVNVRGDYETGHSKPEYDYLSSFTVTYAEESKTVEKNKSETSATYWSIYNAYTGPEGGDGSYLRITVTNAEATPIYIAVPELVDTYIGGETSTISVGVEGKKGETRVIYADVKAGSIAETMLCSDLTAKINNVITAQAADRSAIETLSGDDTTEGSVKKALKDAKAYTDQEVGALSTSLSTTVDAKIKGITDNYALSTDVNAISGSLFDKIDNDVNAEAGLRDAADKALSDDYASRIGALSTSLSNEISSLESTLNGEIAAEVSARTKAIEDLSTSLSNTIDAKDTALENKLSTYTETQVGALSTSLSTTVDAELTALEKKLSGYTDSEILKLSTSLSTTVDAELTALESKLSSYTETYTDGKVLALSTALSNLISSVKDELEDLITSEIDRATNAEEDLGKQISALSTSLSTTVDAKIADEQTARAQAILNLSTALSTELSSEIDRATKAENKITSDFAALSNDIGLSAASSTNMVVTKKDIADLAGAMHFRGITTTDLSTGLSVIPEGTGYYDPSATPPKVPTAGDLVIHATNSKEFVWAGAKWASSGTSGKWYELGDEGIYLKKAEFEAWRDSTLEDRLSSIEHDADAISSAVENKVKVGTGHFDGTTWTDDLTNKTSLSVVKIADEDYYKLIAAGKQDNDVIYILSSDYVNGHDLRIINVGNAISATDAVNLSGMNAAIEAAKRSIVANSLSGVTLNGASFDVVNNIATLNISCINCGNAD